MRVEEVRIPLDGGELLLRNAEEADAEMLLEYLKTTCGETDYLVKEPEEITMTVEEEREFIRKQNEDTQNLMLLGFWNGVYVGNCAFNGMGLKRYRHRVSMGIALFQKYTGMGIGKVMLEQLCEHAAKAGIEQMELEVVTTNERAIALYRKLGFVIGGTMPKNLKYKDGSYADVYWMYKQL